MSRYVPSSTFPRTLKNPNRVLTGIVNKVIDVDSDDSSDYSSDSDSSDSDSDSEYEVVHDFCTRRGAHVVWTTDEWERSGGCDCKRRGDRARKEKKKCGLMEWLGGGKKKKKKERRKSKGKRKECGRGEHSRRYKERVVHEVRASGCAPCGGPSREEHHRGCSCGRGHGRRRHRDEYDEDSDDDDGRAVYRRRRERRRARSRDGGGYRAGDSERYNVPVDVDFREIRRPMNARVVLERNDEEAYGIGPGQHWEPPILAV